MGEPAPQQAASWAEAARWVEAALGLHFPPRLWPDLERGLETAARRLGLPDAAACAQRATANRLDEHEQQVVAECLTIGETYFFRDPQMFEQLATQVLEPLIAARRQGSRHLRLWSAGCASGEEPYSLAMLIARLLPDWRAWNISILATDVNSAALQKGRAGAYGPWSLRGGMPPEYLPFLHDGPDGRKHVDPALRRMVRFARLNLAADTYPSAASTTLAMDLILCRNVLIYFEPARTAAVLARLGRALMDDGWLVTASVELPAGGIPGLTVVHADGLFALRRSGAGVPDARAARSASPRPAAARRVAPVPAPAMISRTEARPPEPAADPVPAATLLERAREHADAGDLPAAERLCREAVEQDKLDPDATYLLASILSEAGRTGDAAAALQRTLYLAPDHLLARFALGTLALGQGEDEAGRRHLARALEQLSGVPGDEVLRGSGGLTARELEGAIRRAGGTP